MKLHAGREAMVNYEISEEGTEGGRDCSNDWKVLRMDWERKEMSGQWAAKEERKGRLLTSTNDPASQHSL